MVSMPHTRDEAMHQNLLRALLRLGSLTDRAKAERVGPWLLIDAGVDMARFNIAVAAEVIDDPITAIKLATDWFEGRAASFCVVARDPHEADMIESAKSLGFTEVEREPAMLLEPLSAPRRGYAGELTVREVTDELDIKRYAELDAPAWHEITHGIARTVSAFPDFTMLLGELHGVAVATSMAVVTGDTVGVFNVLVREDQRGHGHGRAMTLAAIEVGRRAGCAAASLQSTALGLPLYEHLGFRTRYSYRTLMRRSE